MRVKGREFIFFSFVFSSVLSTSEVFRTPLQRSNEKTNLESTAPRVVGVQNKTRSKTPDRELEKRSAQDFYGEKDEKKELNESDLYDQNELEKRARLGFTGMRGKKEYIPNDFCADRLRIEGLNLNKRISKSLNDFMGDKRASLAFHGMRGKKSEDYDGDDPLDFYSNEDFLISSGLMDEPEQGKPEGENLEEMLKKRSPYFFQGMKGKKKPTYDLKRAMGFLGMRGKKATEVWDPEVNYKRTPQTSFFGMKGKKAQSSGFFGMRGKKASPNAFFGIKGKRDLLQLQNFSYLNEFQESDSPKNRYRRAIAWLNNSKKAKNTFFGIRGKKSTQESPERFGLRNYIRDFGIATGHLKTSETFFLLPEILICPVQLHVMRFRFCGDLDCPDWVLAEINTLSKMSSVKVKILCQIVAKSLVGNEYDEEKAKKLVLDAKLGTEDMKACVAALSLILTSSARYGVEEDVLNNELQQLGLPKEHATALDKVYSEHLTALTELLEKKSLRTSTLEDISCFPQDLNRNIELKLKIDDKIQNVVSTESITMTSEQLGLLLTDLIYAREVMKSLPS